MHWCTIKSKIRAGSDAVNKRTEDSGERHWETGKDSRTKKDGEREAVALLPACLSPGRAIISYYKFPSQAHVTYFSSLVCTHTNSHKQTHTHTQRERASVRFQWSPSKWTPQSTLPHDSCAVTVVFKPCIANNVCWPRAVRSSVGLEGFSWCASGWWNKASFYQRVTLFSCLLLTDESLSLPFSAPISCSSCVQWLFLQALMRLIKQPDLCRSDWSVVVVRWSEASGRFIFLVWSCSTWASRQWDTIRSISIWMETWMSREDTGPRPSSAIFPSTTHSPAA